MAKKITKLTAVILTHNSQKDLEELLPQLDWVGKILIIDDDSEDNTVKIAKKHGAKVISRSLDNNWAAQRNTALKQIKTTWAIFLDSDERVSPDLHNEIRKVIWRPGKSQAFKIPRLDIIKGKILKFGELKNQSPIRLGKVKSGIWKRDVHEYWDIEPVGTIKSPIFHYSHQYLFDSINKIKVYAKCDAQYRINQEQDWRPWDIITYPVGKFLYTYFYKLGILDGWTGAYMSLLMSIHSFLVRYHLLRLTLSVPAKISPLKRLLRIGIMSILVAYPLGHLLRIQLNQTTAVYVFEIIMALTILIWIIDLIKSRQYPSLPNYTTGLSIFTLILAISLLVNAQTLAEALLPSSLYWFRWLLYSGLFLVLWDAKHSNWLRINARKTLITLGSISLIFGWIQYAVMPDMRWLFWFGWDDHFYRMVGTLFDPGYLALIIALLFFTLLPKLKNHKILATLTIFGLVLTYARSGYLVFIAGLFIYGFLTKSFFKITTWLAIFISGIVLATILIKPGGEGVNLARTFSVLQRARSVITGWDIFRENPIIGIGFNAYQHHTKYIIEESPVPIHPSSPDSSIALILATSGIIGLAGFTLMITQFYNAAANEPWVITSLSVVLLHSLTNNSFFYPWILIWLAILLTNTPNQDQKSNLPTT